MSEAHAHAPMAMHHDHGWLVVSDASDGVYIKIAKGLGAEKEQSLARLIAAAPDLLEALEGIIGYFDSGNSVSVSQATIKASSDEIKAARAAIAKATGGAAC